MLGSVVHQELHRPVTGATVVFCDNVSSVYMTQNPVHHQCTKHVEIDLHFVRDRVTTGDVRILHVPISSQFADIFTKGLPSPLFFFGIVSTFVGHPFSTEGGC